MSVTFRLFPSHFLEIQFLVLPRDDFHLELVETGQFGRGGPFANGINGYQLAD